MPTIRTCLLSCTAALLGAADVVDVAAISDRILAIQVRDGKAVYAGLGKPGQDRIEEVPLDLARAAQAASYAIASTDDPAYGKAQAPRKVGRKSKGRDFIVGADWKSRYVLEHWLFLELPTAMQAGKSYTVDLSGLATGPVRLAYGPRARSEAVHVSQIGFVPEAPKYAYVSAWLGDLGPLDLGNGPRGFQVLDEKGAKVALSGTVSLRKRAGEADTSQAREGNHQRTDVWECDLSALTAPGRYVVSIDGVGCSFPFAVGVDVHRAPARAALRALYHQRCGVALDAKFTDWPRAVCHHSGMKQTTQRFIDGGYSSGRKDAATIATGEVRDVWGGWHDAGDWDKEAGHFEVAAGLALLYEQYPDRFADGDSGIPESGNGLPDVLDEACWGVDYWKRLQRPDGGVSMGAYASGNPKDGEDSAHDTLEWFLYAEDPQATYRYAAAAAHLASALTVAGKADLAAGYLASARKAWTWAGANQRPGDEGKVRDAWCWAAAAMHRLTGEAEFATAFATACRITKPGTPLRDWGKYDQHWAAWAWALNEKPGRDPALSAVVKDVVIAAARSDWVDTATKRGMRYAWGWDMPTWWGRTSRPEPWHLLVAHRLTGDKAFIDAHHTTMAYLLGGNQLNMTWMTGMGSRSPVEIYHPDSWYGKSGAPVPGIPPEGSCRWGGDKKGGGGAWSVEYTHATAYPPAKEWPPHELWFENRRCPPMCEFDLTFLSDAVTAYSVLCGPAKR